MTHPRQPIADPLLPDPGPLADYGALWSYPEDAGYVTPWPGAVENPDPMLGWPTMYDPYAIDMLQPPAVPSPLPPGVISGCAPGPSQYQTGDLRSVVPQSWWTPFQHAGQEATEALGHGLEGLGEAFGAIPQTLATPGHIEKKAGDAADAVKTQATQVGDDARRTMQMMQASMVNANRHLEETSKSAQSTAEAIKYVALGVGALATIALLFHIVKQSTE